MQDGPRRIETEADLAAAAAALCRVAPRFAPILAATGPLPLRRQPDGFDALFKAIVGQQVSTAAAQAIWGRLAQAGLTGPIALRKAGDADLRAAGLSRAKIAYARALVEADLDFDGLRRLDTEAVVARLTGVPGIGRWTAEIYACFALGHADVFPAGDLALQISAMRAFDLPLRPSERSLRAMAQDWSPLRAVAARALWAYYRVADKPEGRA